MEPQRGAPHSRLRALRSVSWAKLGGGYASRLKCALLVTQLRGLVLCLVLRGHVPARVGSDFSAPHCGAVGRKQNSGLASSMADGCRCVAVAGRRAEVLRGTTRCWQPDGFY